MELTEESARKPARRTTECTYSEQQRKAGWERQEAEPGPRGTLSEGPTGATRVPEAGEREDWVQRGRNEGGNCPKFGKRCNSRSAANTKQEKEQRNRHQDTSHPTCEN